MLDDDVRAALEKLAHPFAYGDPDWDAIAEGTRVDAEIDCCVNITFRDVLEARRILGRYLPPSADAVTTEPSTEGSRQTDPS